MTGHAYQHPDPLYLVRVLLTHADGYRRRRPEDVPSDDEIQLLATGALDIAAEGLEHAFNAAWSGEGVEWAVTYESGTLDPAQHYAGQGRWTAAPLSSHPGASAISASSHTQLAGIVLADAQAAISTSR